MITRNCGLCHFCARPIRKVLDGEEWCDFCKDYQRPISHGWASKDNSPCYPDPPAAFALHSKLAVAKQAQGMAHLILRGEPTCLLCGGKDAPIVGGRHLNPEKWCKGEAH